MNLALFMVFEQFCLLHKQFHIFRNLRSDRIRTRYIYSRARNHSNLWSSKRRICSKFSNFDGFQVVARWFRQNRQLCNCHGQFDNSRQRLLLYCPILDIQNYHRGTQRRVKRRFWAKIAPLPTALTVHLNIGIRNEIYNLLWFFKNKVH